MENKNIILEYAQILVTDGRFMIFDIEGHSTKHITNKSTISEIFTWQFQFLTIYNVNLCFILLELLRYIKKIWRFLKCFHEFFHRTFFKRP